MTSIPDGTLDGLPMTCLFSTPTLPAGNHTLSVQIVQISPPLAVGVDFLTYNASFARLDNLPGYTSSSSSLGQKSHMTGAIAGGVIGGVVFISVVVALIIILRRRNHRPGLSSVLGQNKRIWSGKSAHTGLHPSLMSDEIVRT